MPFATISSVKQKGASVGASGQHNDRTRETPNADLERTPENRLLVGDERNARERVREIIDEHGGKPRSDSVEAVELVLSASHEYFEDEDPIEAKRKLESFVARVVAFLTDRRNCGICAKAVLHLDERTPHVHAHMVPIDPKGKLNAKFFLGGRGKMKALHDHYAEYMKPLGLERGREGSRARHQSVKKFYAAIEKEVEWKLDHERIPDPPKVLLTVEAGRKYKEKVFHAVLAQLKEPLQQLRHQAMLTRDERAHRLEAEKRAAAADVHAGERIVAAEEQAREQIATIQREADERYNNLHRSARAVVSENKEGSSVAKHLIYSAKLLKWNN